MEFKIKRDYLLITLSNLALLFLMFIPFVGLWSEYAAIFFLILFGIVLSIFILYNTAIIFASCELRNNVLVIKTGAFKKVIFLDKVVSVNKLNTIAGSLIFSRERIEIATENKGKREYFYISVVDNEKLYSLISANLPKKAEKMAEKTEKTAQVADKKPAVKKTTKKKVTTKKNSK
ncbi:MAG: hypothetical protein EOM55_02980 [Clostridia bacterium]|nr:hypothetical protein [Clostridia bacterium]